MTESLRLLILGGYGTFGARIVKLLEREVGLTMLIAGRSARKAEAFCAGGCPGLVPAAMDRDGDLAAALTRYRPDILIDASGPF